MDKIIDLLVKCAEEVLRCFLGSGYWQRYEWYDTPKDTIEGLKVGDELFEYDSDEMEFASGKVAIVDEDGVGYSFISRYVTGSPNTCLMLFRTLTKDGYVQPKLKYAIKAAKEDIEADVEYFESRMDKAKAVKRWVQALPQTEIEGKQ